MSTFTSSKIISFTRMKGPYSIMASFDSFASGWFCSKIFITLTESGKIPLLVSSSRSQIVTFIFTSRTSLANLLAFLLMFVVFVIEKVLLGFFLLHSKDLLHLYFPKGLTSFQHKILFPYVLHLFEVLCKMREGTTIKALKQKSCYHNQNMEKTTRTKYCLDAMRRNLSCLQFKEMILMKTWMVSAGNWKQWSRNKVWEKKMKHWHKYG